MVGLCGGLLMPAWRRAQSCPPLTVISSCEMRSAMPSNESESIAASTLNVVSSDPNSRPVLVRWLASWIDVASIRRLGAAGAGQCAGEPFWPAGRPAGSGPWVEIGDPIHCRLIVEAWQPSPSAPVPPSASKDLDGPG
eukprot:scaffold70309_cov32-Tisochrysis_lutea.AAC.2